MTFMDWDISVFNFTVKSGEYVWTVMLLGHYNCNPEVGIIWHRWRENELYTIINCTNSTQNDSGLHSLSKFDNWYCAQSCTQLQLSSPRFCRKAVTGKWLGHNGYANPSLPPLWGTSPADVLLCELLLMVARLHGLNIKTIYCFVL